MTSVAPAQPTRSATTTLVELPLTRTRLARYWNAALVLGAGAAMLVLGYRRRWITDDALIFTQTVEQILRGNGPVYSPGERAEASTSTLWQWLLAGAGFAARETDTSGLAWRLGLLLSTLGIIVAADATRRLYRRDTAGAGRFLLPAGVLVFLAVPPAWDYATSGLETGLTTAWLASCWWLLVRLRDRARRRVWLTAAFVFGLGPLVRPDLALVSVLFAGALWFLVRPRWRGTLAALAAAGALPVAYEVFRMGYYGLVFPMPALTKEAGGSLWGRGADYVGNMTGVYELWLPLLAVAVLLGTLAVGLRRDTRTLVVLLTPVIGGLLMTLYVTKVGGDYMHGRMLLPPLLMLLFPVFVVPAKPDASRTAARGVPLLATALVACWAVVCATSLRTGPIHDGVIDDERRYYVQFTETDYPLDSGAYAKAFSWLRDVVARERAAGRKTLVYFDPKFKVMTAPLRPDLDVPVAVVAVYLGASPTVLPEHARLVDFWGLVNPLGAHMVLTGAVKPGHEKPLSNVWILADYADPAAEVDPAGNFARPDPVTREAVEAARRALECGDLKELRESTREPMSAKRFWKNLTGAVSRTQLRVPVDPFEAERKFCRGGG